MNTPFERSEGAAGSVASSLCTEDGMAGIKITGLKKGVDKLLSGCYSIEVLLPETAGAVRLNVCPPR